jgi:hypothetical protein
MLGLELFALKLGFEGRAKFRAELRSALNL